MRKLLSIIVLTSALNVCATADVITDLSAVDAVEYALENSMEMAVADNAVQQAELNKRIARTAYLPNFSGAATGSWILPDSEIPDLGITMRMRGIYMAGINVMQPIFAGGKIIAANKMAKIGANAAEEQRRQTRIAVAANAETSYWTYVAVLAKVEMMKSYRALIDTAYAQTQQAFNAGMATKNDLLRIEARRSQIDYQQGQVNAGADLCRMALCNAMGIPTHTQISVADTNVDADIQIPENPEDFDLSLRPEFRLLQADINAKKQEINMTRADFLPKAAFQAGWFAFGGIETQMQTLDPAGNVAMTSSKFNTDGWVMMLSLQVPLFHWGEGIKKVKHARLEAQNAEFKFEHTAQQLELQVRQAISNLRTGTALVQSARSALKQAEAALESTSTSYSLGLASITDLLDAQSQWHTAKADLIEAYTQLRINLIDYRAATATL